MRSLERRAPSGDSADVAKWRASDAHRLTHSVLANSTSKPATSATIGLATTPSRELARSPIARRESIPPCIVQRESPDASVAGVGSVLPTLL